MDEALRQLEESLAAAESDEERIALLNREASERSRSEPRCGLRLAKRALNIAAADHDVAGQSESYCTVGICHFYLTNLAAAVSNLRKAYRLAERANDDRGCGRALANLGVVLIRAGQYPQALDVLMQALELFEGREDDTSRSFVSMVQRNLGVLYGDLNDYPKSLECYHRSMRIKEELGEPIASDLNNLGATFYSMGNLEKALDYFRQALERHRSAGDRLGEAMTLTNIAEVDRNLGHYEESRDSYQQALEIHEQIGDRSGALYALLGVAAYHRHVGEFDVAGEYLEQAKRVAEELGIPQRLLELRVEQGELMVDAGNSAAAIDIFCAVIEMAGELGDQQTLILVHERLSQLHEQQGDIIAAFEHHKEQDRIRREIIGQEQQHTITTMQMRYEVEKAEQERELLKLKNQQLELEMQHRMKELTALAMQLVQKNEMLDELKKQIGAMVSGGNGSASASARELAPLLRQIDTSRNSEQEWETFEQQFRMLHPEFMDRLAKQCSELSPTELKVCALLKINLATKDIANILCCSTRTVEDHRYRIRTKLDLPKGANLMSYLVGVS